MARPTTFTDSLGGRHSRIDKIGRYKSRAGNSRQGSDDFVFWRSIKIMTTKIKIIRTLIEIISAEHHYGFALQLTARGRERRWSACVNLAVLKSTSQMSETRLLYLQVTCSFAFSVSQVLTLAVKYNHIENAKLLLEYGANPNGIGSVLNLPFTWPYGMVSLQWLKSFSRMVLRLMDESGLRIPNFGTIPLYTAIIYDRFDEFILLLRYGAEPNLIMQQPASQTHSLMAR